jgi:hypothetical protein
VVPITEGNKEMREILIIYDLLFIVCICVYVAVAVGKCGAWLLFPFLPPPNTLLCKLTT